MTSTISIVDEEYRYQRSQGHTKGIALRKALFYSRVFSAREVTALPTSTEKNNPHALAIDCFSSNSILHKIARPDGFLVSEGSWNDANISPEERVCFNQLFRLLFAFAKSYHASHNDSIGLKYIARLVVLLNLEQILAPEFQQEVEETLQAAGIDQLRKKADFAALCGYAIRAGSKTPITFERRLSRFEKELRGYASELSEVW